MQSVNRKSIYLLPAVMAVFISLNFSSVSAETLNVGTVKQVFIDGRFIANSRNVKLVVNKPRITGEKLIVPNKPWEDFYLGAYTTVIQEGDRIHMWYETADKRGLKDLTAVAYANSTDGGATWTKPNLGIIEYEGSTNNNLVMTEVHGSTVFRNRPDAPPSKKYCMFVAQTKGAKPKEYPSKAFYSADGLHWKAIEKVPFLDVSGLSKYHSFHLDSQNVTFWDSRLKKYVMMPRINDGATRTIGRTESPVFGDFPTPEIVFRPDKDDLPNMDFYTSAAIQYSWAADAYYMFPATYYITSMQKNDGPIDIQFAASRNGADWLRPDRHPIIRMGFDNQWDNGALYAGYGLSRQGDELSLYYSAYDVTHGAYVERGYLGGIITRAIYRLDGFMSIDSDYKRGEFVTPTLVFGGDRLEINFDGSAGGWARVEIQDKNGKPIPSFTEKDSDKITGNSVRKPVSWGGKKSLSSLKGKKVKLRFVMRDAKLYAFQFPESSVSAELLDISTAKQVFIDNRFIAKSSNVELVVNRPRVTGEKLILADKPWEDFYIGDYTSVIQESDRIHMWYETRDLRGTGGMAYAYSIDGGATWTKPNLGVIEYEGSKDNNLVITGTHGSTVFRNRPNADPQEKFCAFVGSPNRMYVSPDGIHWKQYGKEPFLDMSKVRSLPGAMSWTLDSQNVIFWDTRLQKYVAYPRINFEQPADWAATHFLRKYARMESKTLGDFGDFQVVFAPDDKDPKDFDHYTTAAIEYPFAADAYYMFPAAYHHLPSPPAPSNDGPIDIQFAASRDGINWLQPDRRPIIRSGFEGQWNDGVQYAGYGFSRQGDELSLYYTGTDVTHGAYKIRGYLRGTITRAIYRLDGFMSVDSDYKGGEFITPAMVFGGDRLEINFDGSAGGWARVEIQDKNGKPIPSFTEKDSDKITGNSVRKPVSWKGKSSLSSLKGKLIKLRFIMRDAKLYAFQFPERTQWDYPAM